MGTQGAGRKRLPNRERLTAEDDALNQIAREVSGTPVSFIPSLLIILILCLLLILLRAPNGRPRAAPPALTAVTATPLLIPSQVRGAAPQRQKAHTQK